MVCVGRVHMAAPSMASYRRPGGIRRGRNSNKHKRLFEGGEGSLPNGEKVRSQPFAVLCSWSRHTWLPMS